MQVATFNILYFSTMGIHVILYIINFGICLFLWCEFKKPKSMFNSPYFIILNSYYTLELFCKPFWVYGRTINFNIEDPLLVVVLTTQWYDQCIQGVAEAFLGLTRCTALAFPTSHDRLWRGKRLWIVLAMIYVSPFAFFGYMFSRFDCKFLSSYEGDCLQYRNDTILPQIYTSVAFNFLCLVFIGIGLIFAPKGYQKSQKFKIEHRLMIQSFISASLVILFYGQMFIPFFTDTNDYYVASYIIYILHYYPPMFYVFLVTPTIRKDIIKFYFSWFKKLSNLAGESSTSVSQITMY